MGMNPSSTFPGDTVSGKHKFFPLIKNPGPHMRAATASIFVKMAPSPRGLPAALVGQWGEINVLVLHWIRGVLCIHLQLVFQAVLQVSVVHSVLPHAISPVARAAARPHLPLRTWHLLQPPAMEFTFGVPTFCRTSAFSTLLLSISFLSVEFPLQTSLQLPIGSTLPLLFFYCLSLVRILYAILDFVVSTIFFPLYICGWVVLGDIPHFIHLFLSLASA